MRPRSRSRGGLIERDDIRLLSLTGPAGVGKTRLALEIAAVCAAHFDGNVSFVPLATLTDTSLLLGEIGSTLGVADSVNPIAGVRQLLRGSTRLLVARQPRAIAKRWSRAGAAAAGGGGTDHSDHQPFAARDVRRICIAGRSPADSGARGLMLPSWRRVRRFGCWLTARVRPTRLRAIPSSDFPLLAEIARRVDGLPLALELAGVYIPLLGARGVLDKLRDAFSVLCGGTARLARAAANDA